MFSAPGWTRGGCGEDKEDVGRGDRELGVRNRTTVPVTFDPLQP